MKKIDNIYLVSFLLFFILTLFTFRYLVFTNYTYFARDMQGEHQPARIFTAESLIKGDIPLWNPYSYCGIPFMANMVSAVWYPLNIIFYFFPFVIGLNFYYIIHFTLAAFLGYLFAKKCNLPIVGAWIIGILFAFNGFMMTKLEFLSNVGAALWLPAMCMLRLSPFLIGILFSFAFLASSNQQIIFQLIAIFIFSISIRKITAKLFLMLFAGCLCSIIISCVQLLPAIELYIQSSRFISGLTQNAVNTVSLTLKDLISLGAPYLVEQNRQIMFGERFYWATGMHVGIIACVIALSGFIFSSLKNKIIIFSILIFCVLISLGNNFKWLFNITYKYVFFLNYFRFPSLIIYLITFIIIIFCMISIKKLRTNFMLLIVVSIFIELSILNDKILPLMYHKIFYYRGPIISFLISNLNKYRFILTPISENNSEEKNIKIYRQSNPNLMWCQSHDKVSGNIGVPYHFYHAGGFENIPSMRHVMLFSQICSISDTDKFLKEMAEAGIKYIIATHEVDENLKHINIPHWANIIENPYVKEGQKLKVVYYEGWKAYYKGKMIPVFADEKGWMSVPKEYENKEIKYRYDPVIYKIGFIITLVAVLFMILKGFQFVLLSTFK